MPSPLPRWDHGEGGSLPERTVTAAFPVSVPGRLPRRTFRGLLSVHARYGLPARGAACATLSIGSFGRIVTSPAAPLATGWNDSCRVGLAPTEDRHLCTAHTPGRRRGCPRRLPQIRTCPIKASGSSRHSYAVGRYTEWTTMGGGSAKYSRSRSKRSHEKYPAHERRLSHFRQIPATAYRRFARARPFPVIP
jgi:hypothetical protein